MAYEIEIPGRAIVEVPDDVPVEEAQRVLAKQYPPTGSDIYEALKADPSFVPTEDQFKLYEGWNKTKQTDWVNAIGQGVQSLLSTAGAAAKEGVTSGAAINPANYLEGVAQGTRQLYELAAQSQDPDSLLFKFKNLIAGDGTITSRYEQFLEARKFGAQSAKYATGEETILPKEMVNPQFAQGVSLFADPTFLMPGIGEVLGIGKLATKATGAAARGVGRAVEAVARPLESAIQTGADVITEATGIGAGGLRSAAASTIGAGLVTGNPLVAAIAAAPTAVSAAREIGQAIGMAGENLATQPSRIGALEAVGRIPGANLRQRALGAIGRSSADAVLDYGLRGTAGALEGAAIGAGIGLSLIHI